jgi:Secretion system C-terminal sorting domain
MKRLIVSITILMLVAVYAFSQTGTQFVPDSLTKALWHFNESSGSLVSDTSAFANNGQAFGTGIFQGPLGNYRSFNGVSDYVYVPSSASLNFGISSFSIDIWFRTSASHGTFLRKGLVPDPGYQVSIYYGHVAGIIGNYQGSTWSDTLLFIVSKGTYNDNTWHLATLVRDRPARQLLLYIDGVSDAQPVTDLFSERLDNDDPLTFGAWAYGPSDLVEGDLDEIRLSGLAKDYSPSIMVFPDSLNFGKHPLSTHDSLSLRISNMGIRDSLHVTHITSDNSQFQVADSGLVIAPALFHDIQVRYIPTTAGIDTGNIILTSDDSLHSTLRIPVRGVGIKFLEAPIIDTVTWDTQDYTVGHVAWFRSSHDSSGDLDTVTQYSVWRVAGSTWEVALDLPALRIDRYSAVVGRGAGLDSKSATVFMVAAQTKSGQVYQSAPDTVIWGGPILGVKPGADDGAGRVGVPIRVELFQNYPNPFNPSTTIRYSVPTRSRVVLTVYNTLGQQVASLVNGEQEAGFYSVIFEANNLASGVYFFRLQTGSYFETKELLLLR